MKLVFTPDWFLGSDIAIEGISFLVLLAFFILSWRSYKLNKNKNALYLGIGFLIISLAEFSTILTKLVLYYDVFFSQQIGQMIVTYKITKSVDFFYYLGFFFHKMFTLLGLYVIYSIHINRKSSREVILALYFLLISAIFGNMLTYLFHITALILLIFILGEYIEIYKKNKLGNTRVLIIAFSMLALSQIIFMMSQMNIFYVVGQIIQLVSYLMLLVLIMRILMYGRINKHGKTGNSKALLNKYGRKKKK